MKAKSSTQKRFEWRDLFWLGGAELAALAAVVLAIPYIISRLVAIYRGRA